jgi:hypothetical protein
LSGDAVGELAEHGDVFARGLVVPARHAAFHSHALVCFDGDISFYPPCILFTKIH